MFLRTMFPRLRAGISNDRDCGASTRAPVLVAVRLVGMPSTLPDFPTAPAHFITVTY